MGRKEYSRKWYLANKEKAKQSSYNWQKTHRKERNIIVRRSLHKKWRLILDKNRIYNEKRRKLVLQHYGGLCVCCKEKEYKFLTIDHINNDGAKQNRELKTNGGSRIVQWLIKNNYPSGYTILCYNCNCGRYRNKGVCPHVA